MSIIIKLLSIEDIDNILPLVRVLNPSIETSVLKKRQLDMFQFDNYRCFGVYNDNELMGVSSGWITVKLYSGKQIELDNVIINPAIQSSGLGTKLISLIEEWAKENNCETVELNTYVLNSRSHKFYFNQGFQIIGYHFQKQLD